MSRIGVLGGTFDPIHVGHLVAAEWVRDACALDEVVFVPAGTPPHKDERDVSPAEARLAMTELATRGQAHFSVSRVDVDRDGPSYTVDTLARLRSQRDGAELHFMLGADALGDVPDWYEPERLLAENCFVAITRPGWNIDAAWRRLGSLGERFRTRIRQVEIPGIEISSSEIRARLRAGRTVRYLVPDPVLRYIGARSIYTV